MYLPPSPQGWSEVYLVQDQHTKRSCALKTLSLHPDYGLGNLSEVDILCRLRHPSLLRAKRIVEVSPGCLGLILPLSKWTLATAIQQKILLPSEEIAVMWRLSSALTFLHQHKLLHCNLQSKVILLQGRVGTLSPVIADFADSCREQTSYSRPFPVTIYTAPELSSTSTCTVASDVWSLGVIFFEILTQQLNPTCPCLDDPETRLNFLRQHLRCHRDGVDLLFRVLDPNPRTRLSSQDLPTSSFFTTRGLLGSIEGEVETTQPNPEQVSLETSWLNETFPYVMEAIPTCSTTSWLGAIELYLDLGVDNLVYFWVALWLNHKLYDIPPSQANLNFFLDMTGLASDLFLGLEQELLLSRGGCLNSSQ